MFLTSRDLLVALAAFLLFFPVDALALVFLYAALGSRAREASRHWEYLATHDDLSDLHNRRGFLTALRAAPSSGRAYGLVLLDLDHFKAVNDSHGHPTGNTLLTKVGQRLSTLLGPTVLAAGRLSGDEYALLVAGDRDQIRAAAHDAIHAISAAPIDLGAMAVTIGASAGYTHATLGVNADQLLSEADHALYEAKRAGRGTVHGYRPWTSHTDRALSPRPRDQRDH